MTDQQSEGLPDVTEEYAALVKNKSTDKEAGGVCFAHLYTKGGTQISITARAKDPINALQMLMETLTYGVNAYHLSNSAAISPAISPPAPTKSSAPPPAPQRPQQPAPAPTQSDVQPPAKIMKVKAIRMTYTKDGTSKYIRAHTDDAAFAKFGIAAYDNSWPEGFDILQYPPEQQFQPPTNMQYIEIDPTGKKVVRFMETPS